MMEKRLNHVVGEHSGSRYRAPGHGQENSGTSGLALGLDDLGKEVPTGATPLTRDG